MRLLWLVILFTLPTLNSFTQYYLRGEVRDEQGKPLSNVKINLTSKGSYAYYSGSTGSFGIPAAFLKDTIQLSLNGYETLKLPVDITSFTSFTLRTIPGSLNVIRHRLSSFTKDLTKQENNISIISNESYSRSVENDLVNAKNYPETGFALNVDRASYSNIRRFLNVGTKVPREAVRIEEMLNYFNLNSTNDSLPRDSFLIRSTVTSAPWNKDAQLLYLNVKAPRLDLDSLPPSNLVFLIDVSGSMEHPSRLPLLQNAFKLLVQNLREKDTVSIVLYGGTVAVALHPTSGKNKEKIINVIDSLSASGDTPGGAAIAAAYAIARRSFIKEGNNRVILATDGDFNVGQASEKELEEMISQHRETGIYLTCLGVGMGNYKDSKLEVLAKKGNGNFAYLDNIKEAEKVLVKEFTNTLFTVANDVDLTIQFDPVMVDQYRLIGFDNKAEAISDQTSKLEGGEVGTGHSMVALFEIRPTETGLRNLKDSLSAPLAKLSIQYTPCLKNDSATIQQAVISFNAKEYSKPDTAVRSAIAIAMFGSLLRGSKYVSYDWDTVLEQALAIADLDDPIMKELVELIEKSKKIYAPPKKKKGRKK